MLFHHRGACAIACLRMSGYNVGRVDSSLIPCEVKQGLSCWFLLLLLLLCSVLQDSEPMGLLCQPPISLEECWNLRCKPLHPALSMDSSSCSQACSQPFFLMNTSPALYFSFPFVWISTYVLAHRPMCLWRSAEDVGCLALLLSAPRSQGLSLNLKQSIESRLTGQSPPGISHFCHHQLWGCKHKIMANFYLGTGDLNPGLMFLHQMLLFASP